MQLQIFDVEHGACALLTTDNGARVMIDCGHNATTGWKPGTYLRQNGIMSIDVLAITNYDEDHVSGINDLLEKVQVHHVWRNASVSPEVIRNLKSEDGMGPGVEGLVIALQRIFTGPPTAIGTGLRLDGLQWNAFSLSYPHFDDENNLSMVLFLRCHGVGVMFTGDLEKAGWREFLKDAGFRQALMNTNVFIASHHGRENGVCEEVADYLGSVFYVVISDKGYMYDTQETLPFYQRVARGGPFRSERQRRVLSTRSDGRIGFNFYPTSWGPY